MQVKQITEFSFWEFCVAVQDAIQQGFVFSTDNDKMPTAYVGNYNCVMVKDISEDLSTIKESVVEAVQSLPKETVVDALIPESKTAQPKGRKPKTN